MSELVRHANMSSAGAQHRRPYHLHHLQPRPPPRAGRIGLSRRTSGVGASCAHCCRRYGC
eukprot:2960817-Pleurochrysis_carterae.AAC.2